jgi:hypothetical protein
VNIRRFFSLTSILLVALMLLLATPIRAEDDFLSLYDPSKEITQATLPTRVQKKKLAAAEQSALKLMEPLLDDMKVKCEKKIKELAESPKYMAMAEGLSKLDETERDKQLEEMKKSLINEIKPEFEKEILVSIDTFITEYINAAEKIFTNELQKKQFLIAKKKIKARMKKEGPVIAKKMTDRMFADDQEN